MMRLPIPLYFHLSLVSRPTSDYDQGHPGFWHSMYAKPLKLVGAWPRGGHDTLLSSTLTTKLTDLKVSGMCSL